MNAIWSYILAHPTTSSLVAFWLGSNIVSALPSPNASSNGFYKFVFALGHGLAGSLTRVFPQLRLPGDPTAGSPTFFAAPKAP